MKPLIVAVAVALLGLVFMRQHLQSERERLNVPVDRVAVLVTTQSIAEGEALRGDALNYRLVVRDEQPWSSIKFEDPDLGPDARRRFEDIKAVLHGRNLGRGLQRNEFVLWTDLEDRQVSRLSGLFEGRLRAIAVAVDRASLMGGLLAPNDRVDVLATFSAGMTIRGGPAEAHDKTLVVLEDVTVLSVGGRMGGDGGNLRGGGGGETVTLALSPEQALLLSHVQGSARISLLLRPLETAGAGVFDPSRREVSSGDVQDSIEKLMDRLKQNLSHP